jgi:hypothetical protein
MFSNICAVMDAQCFVVNGKYYPKEIAVITDIFKKNYLCQILVKKDQVQSKDRITNNYIANCLLGISMWSEKRPGSLKNSRQVIVDYYNSAKCGNKELVAIKNNQLQVILIELGIPFINLDEHGCDSLEQLKEQYNVSYCSFHDLPVPDRRKIRCAEQKCEFLWRWLNDYQKAFLI